MLQVCQAHGNMHAAEMAFMSNVNCNCDQAGVSNMLLGVKATFV